MDKVNLYKKIVSELVTEIAAMTPEQDGGIENQLIIDDKHGHYLLFYVGWEGTKHYYATFAHFDVKPNGRVWLQHDGTDLKLAEELTQRGIPKSDIVIGFRPQHIRMEMEGYAVT
jgi:XisI protein